MSFKLINYINFVIDFVTEPWNFGRPTCVCEFCGALHWYEERNEKSKKTKHPRFSMCCMEGRVHLPLIKSPPHLLQELLDYSGNSTTKAFRRNIRIYNAAFAFTSMGGKVDHEINKHGGPYVFRINGQIYHLHGSLTPADGQKPKFAQLYIYDTDNEVSNRLGFAKCDDGNNSLQEEVVRDILHMLDEHNSLVKSYRMARDKYRENTLQEFKLRLIGSRSTNGRQNNLPSCSEVAALLVEQHLHEDSHRDIIVEHRKIGLQRITELHPKFMALQYPLLFPYGEDGYTNGLSHQNPETGKTYKRQTVTMRQYYAFRIQQRAQEGQTLLRGGRLFQQYLVDSYACIEEGRLNWIKKNQKQLRVELYSGLRDALNQGDVTTDSIGRMTILPSTYTGGPRYRVQNYQVNYHYAIFLSKKKLP